MGQKVHPVGFRLGVSRQPLSRWYAGRDMPMLLGEDRLIRDYIQ
jgi:small subunit ribosomal protein S3